MTSTSTQFLGYYNPNDFPVSFSSGQAQAAPIEVQPQQPVVDGLNKLLPWPHPVLEQQVSLGLLTRIAGQDPKFINWNKMQEQRRSAQVARNYRPTHAIRDNRETREMHPPEVNISSQHGVQRVDTNAKYGELPPGTKVLDNGFEYDGRQFANRVAMETYIQAQQTAVTESGPPSSPASTPPPPPASSPAPPPIPEQPVDTPASVVPTPSPKSESKPEFLDDLGESPEVTIQAGEVSPEALKRTEEAIGALTDANDALDGALAAIEEDVEAEEKE